MLCRIKKKEMKRKYFNYYVDDRIDLETGFKVIC